MKYFDQFDRFLENKIWTSTLLLFLDPGLTVIMDLSLVGKKECTDQFVSDLVDHVGVVKSSSLVLPPAPDVDTRFLFKIGKMEVIPVKYKYTDSAQNYYKFNAETKQRFRR